MSPLAKLRWLAVPLAAYLVITLVMPLANGAAQRPDFVRHAAYILGGCLAVLAVVLIAVTLTELIRWTWRKP